MQVLFENMKTYVKYGMNDDNIMMMMLMTMTMTMTTKVHTA